jgi:hypothetical protein
VLGTRTLSPPQRICIHARPARPLYHGRMVRYLWCGEFDNAELNHLHAQGVDHAVLEDDRRGQVERHSLRPFYLDGCGFRPTAAGLIELRP